MDPLTAMAHRAHTWQTKWSGSRASPDRIRFLLEAVRTKAREQPMEPFTVELLQVGIQRMRGSAAKGVEQLGKRDLQWLPPSGLQQLTDLYQHVEEQMAWPWQLLMVLVTLTRKASGDDRAIGVVSTLARLWSSCRGQERAAWTREKAGWWDAAVAGSSALREALLRCYMDETVSLSSIKGWIQASVLWDIEGFYDALQWDLLLEKGLQHDLPAQVLGLEMLMHMACRVLKDSGYFSEALYPCMSMIAGLGGAVDFSRCVLYDILEATARGSPGASVRSWVDDVTLRVEGRARRVVGVLKAAGLAFAEGCREAGLVISSKSTIISGDTEVAKQLQQHFADHGFQVKVQEVAADLGIDRGRVGARRPKQSARRAGAGRRLVRLRRFAQGSVRRRIATKVALMGVLPMGGYSDRVYGTAPSVILRWRRAVAQTVAKSGLGDA